jgi:hypothetical protein
MRDFYGCRLQHPPELIPEMIKKWEEGFDVVLTSRKYPKISISRKKHRFLQISVQDF